MIGTAVHSDNGEKLWNVTKKKKNRSLSQNVDSSDCMMLRRFKEIKTFVPDATADPKERR